MSWEVGHPVQRDGTYQEQRLLPALNPGNAPVDGRKPEELVLFVYELAGVLKYYNYYNQPEGNWQVFFPEEIRKAADSDATRAGKLEKIRAYLTTLGNRQDHSAFMAILLAFLELFRYAQQGMNALSEKHLSYYYERLLGFRRLPARPDTAHVLFELSAHLPHYRIPAGTVLLAGKDIAGVTRNYVTDYDITVNHAQVSSIRSTLALPEAPVYAAAVANSADGAGAALDPDLPQWPLFGDPAYMYKCTLGFALCSPLLRMDSGLRMITIKLAVRGRDEDLALLDVLLNKLNVEASSAQGWIPLEFSFDSGNYTLTCTVLPEQPAIIAASPELLGNNLSSPNPWLRLTLPPDEPAYHPLRRIMLTQVALSVSVGGGYGPGLSSPTLWNAQGALDTQTRFLPFGPAPAKGDMLFIDSPEVFSKPVEKLWLNFHWAGLPKSFAEHYKSPSDSKLSYPTEYKTVAKFQVNIILDKTKSVEENSEPLFIGESEIEEYRSIELNIKNDRLRAPLCLALEQDFGHGIYPVLYAKVSKTAGATDFPNAPYTPALHSFSLGYQTSEHTISPGAQPDGEGLFHILPFGSQAMPVGAGMVPELPRAALYIGLKDLQPPQSLHLLFRIAESAEIAQKDAIRSEDIRWDYLTATGWRAEAMEAGERYHDSSLGLQQTGIIAFQIGADAVSDAPQMPRGLTWLRASLPFKDPAAAARALDIQTQAVRVTFRDQGNSPAHYLSPLPPDSIQQLESRTSAIRKLRQPYPSFGARAAENDMQFFARISERLRHKQRAASFWDIERLVLQQFPELSGVKVISHTGFDPATGAYTEFMPGQFTVVLIPGLKNPNAFKTLQPNTSVALRESVSRFLHTVCAAALARPGAAIHVINPVYEPILLSFQVGFHEGEDPGIRIEDLQQALRRRLSPWLYDPAEPLRFGACVYRSQLLAFVEQQPYVDYVTDFRMYRGVFGPGIGEMSVEFDFVVRGADFSVEVEMAKASTAASVLSSVPRHNIRPLRPGEYLCASPESTCSDGGIGCWYIEIDFEVSPV